MQTFKVFSAFLVTLFLANVAYAQDGSNNRVYKWKDSNGVTQYSQTPPPGNKYDTRNINNPNVAAANPAKADDKPKSEVEQNCAQAKLNLAQINQPNTQLMVDRDGDGKREAMSDEEKMAQKDLAMRQVQAFCGDAATAKN